MIAIKIAIPTMKRMPAICELQISDADVGLDVEVIDGLPILVHDPLLPARGFGAEVTPGQA